MFAQDARSKDRLNDRLVLAWILTLALAMLSMVSSCSATKHAGERFIPVALGTATGAGTGLLIGGPPGALIGAGVGSAVTSIATPDCAEHSARSAQGMDVDVRRAPLPPPEEPSLFSHVQRLALYALLASLAYWQRARLWAALKAAWGLVPARALGRLRRSPPVRP